MCHSGCFMCVNVCHPLRVHPPSLLLLLLGPGEAGAGVELEEDDVPVLDGVVLSLLPVAPRSLHGRLGAVLLESAKVGFLRRVFCVFKTFFCVFKTLFVFLRRFFLDI